MVPPVTEFVARPQRGRRFSHTRRVRLGDAGPGGSLRPDGAARFLQDVATDDYDELDIDRDLTWVVRRTVLRVTEGGRWPLYGELVTLTTWCGGTGGAWAERRTDIEVSGRTMIETASLWVPIDATGRIQRLRQSFLDAYGEAVGGRKVSGRVALASVPDDAARRPWLLRRSDLDILGHVNNAALWLAMSEVATGLLASASMVHHGSVEDGDDVTLVTSAGHLWLTVDGSVRVSGRFSPPS
jgi:acyl-ACP thioesterase